MQEILKLRLEGCGAGEGEGSKTSREEAVTEGPAPLL